MMMMMMMLAAMSAFISTLGLIQITVRRPPQLIPAPSRWIRRTVRSNAFSGDDAVKTVPGSGPIPRAAVSTVVQCRIEKSTAPSDAVPIHNYQYFYLLVKRGKEPNKGMWSLPGGKLEWGEPTLAGAQRELDEETTWPNDAANLQASLQWYNGTICATESIGEGYHYLIAQCFAQLTIPAGTAGAPPLLEAADDAAAVGWFTRDTLKKEEKLRDGTTTPGVVLVIDRAEELSRKGLLPVN